MAAEIKNELGKIVISEDLIASIAGYATGENYGIVAMSNKGAADAFLQLVGSDNVKRGVNITITENNRVRIELYVTLMYGVSLPAVANNVITNVKYKVEELTGLAVEYVNIFVESIRV